MITELSQDMTAEQYHAYPAVSNSRLSDFIEDPRLYHYKWLSGKYKPKSQRYFDLGTAVHEKLLLNKTSWLVVPPKVLGKNGSKNTKAYREWSAEFSDYMQLTVEEHQTVMSCCEAVYQNPTATELLRLKGDPELPMTADYMGCECKCRFDKLCYTPNGAVILDVKTTGKSSTASSFVKSVTSYGYHRQAAIYKTIAELNEMEVLEFIFLVVSTSEPFTVDLFSLDAEFIDIGLQEVDAAITELIKRTQNNDWSGRGAGSIVSLSPPGYLKYKGDYQV
mgnify:CR=1 FL=1